MGCIAVVRCVLVLRCGSAGVVWYAYAGWSFASACIFIQIYITSIQFNPIQFSGYLLNFGRNSVNAENKASTKK